MSTPPAALRMVEVSGAKVVWLLEGSALGRLVYTQRDLTVIRPGRHTWEYGRLMVGTPAPVDVITDPDEDAHYQRTLTGWTHGLHDTLLRLNPKTVSGFRLSPAEA
ncbi:pyridoxamine 5'-phosphate oxidase family protein [Streptomyces sp. NPDC058086]|uniref:pyridoxamine 5'-phosphate oxidase family protein n=1 Tax=Streptomyces sp. NPDC058086 TaxID=3346334 RepID=UPI0036EAFD25